MRRRRRPWAPRGWSQGREGTKRKVEVAIEPERSKVVRRLTREMTEMGRGRVATNLVELVYELSVKQSSTAPPDLDPVVDAQSWAEGRG